MLQTTESDTRAAVTAAQKCLEDMFQSFQLREQAVHDREKKAQTVIESANKQASEMLKNAKANEQQILKTVKANEQQILKRARTEAQGILQSIDQEKRAWAQEQQAVAATKTFDKSIMKLNVGGTHFTTTRTTLTRFPQSVLGAMFSGRHNILEDDDGAYFIDRDGSVFSHILNFLRAPEKFNLNLVPKQDTQLFLQEFEFYGLDAKLLYIWTSEQVWDHQRRSTHTVQLRLSGEIHVDGFPARYCRNCDRIFVSNNLAIGCTSKNDSCGRVWPREVIRVAYAATNTNVNTNLRCLVCGYRPDNFLDTSA